MEKKEQEGFPYEMPAPYGDGDIPEIDLPGKAIATNQIPDEFPGRDNAAQRQSEWVR